MANSSLVVYLLQVPNSMGGGGRQECFDSNLNVQSLRAQTTVSALSLFKFKFIVEIGEWIGGQTDMLHWSTAAIEVVKLETNFVRRAHEMASSHLYCEIDDNRKSDGR